MASSAMAAPQGEVQACSLSRACCEGVGPCWRFFCEGVSVGPCCWVPSALPQHRAAVPLPSFPARQAAHTLRDLELPCGQNSMAFALTLPCMYQQASQW